MESSGKFRVDEMEARICVLCDKKVPPNLKANQLDWLCCMEQTVDHSKTPMYRNCKLRK